MPKRIIFPAKARVALENFQLEDLGPTDVLVRTEYSLMSIGTELTVLHQRYDADSHFARIFGFPQVKTGVQAVGRVLKTGESVVDHVEGQRVFMRMAHGSHQIQPSEKCSVVPETMDPKLACWCGLAKTAFRAAWAGRFGECSSVLILGAGPVGQMALRWARAEGVSEIVVVDLSTFRLEHAVRGGASQVIAGDLKDQLEALSRMDAGRGPALVVDTTGNPEVFTSALAVLARFGKLILLGDTGYPDRQHLTSDVMSKGLTIQATHDSHDIDDWDQARIDRRFFQFAMDGHFDLDGLISHEFHPDECEAAYQLAEEKRNQVMGLLFDWSDGKWD